MTHHERLTVDNEVGDLFDQLEPVSKTLLHIAEDLLAPGRELGTSERDTITAMLQLCSGQVESILVSYDLRMGVTGRGSTQYMLRLAREAEAAERCEALQLQSSMLVSGDNPPAVQRNAAQMRTRAADLPDAEAVPLLETLLQAGGFVPDAEAS